MKNGTVDWVNKYHEVMDGHSARVCIGVLDAEINELDRIGNAIESPEDRQEWFDFMKEYMDPLKAARLLAQTRLDKCMAALAAEYPEEVTCSQPQ